MIELALRSLLMRRTTALLTALSLAVSVALLLGVERIADAARTSFQSTISGTHLIVGARSGPVQLLLHSVFRIGSPTQAMGYEHFQWLSTHPEVAWAIPISLGDSHQGFPVVGTSDAYFEHYRFGRGRALEFLHGHRFEKPLEVVIGARVARRLGYGVGAMITLSHGMVADGFLQHPEQQFRVVGVLRPTATPVDRSLHIALSDVQALHAGWQDGVPPGFAGASPEHSASEMDHEPEPITAVLVGLRSTVAVFQLQREINQREGAPLSAILPAPTLVEIWSMVDVVNNALELVAGLVLLAALMGMLSMILAGLDQRRREMAILRAVGARRRHIFTLLMAESAALSFAGCAAGVVLLCAAVWIGAPRLEARFGLDLPLWVMSVQDLSVIGVLVLCGMLAGIIPAWRAYRRSLADGLSVRL